MYFKLAIKNIKKSFKDYALYFITITLAVCIFYNFNSIDSQKAMKDIKKMCSLVKAISYISIFISIIFGGLIVYANNSLVKKRKKEFGIYATLGMSRKKISQILICETFIVGLISLIVGLLLGILLSQGISVLTGKLFEFNMTEYTFIISISAISKTLFYFGIMFILVMIFNTIVISKQKLINMITASNKNESVKIRNPIISIIIFILSLIILGRAYYLGWKFVPTPKNTNFPLSILLGGLGTLLFFFGLSGFILTILKNIKKIYFKKLNIFIIKQFNNKINTNFISMAIICLMLFVTIVILSMGLSFKYATDKSLENIMPFDAKIQLNISNEKQEVQDIEKALKKVDFNLNNSFKYVISDDYWVDIKISSLLNQYANKNLKEKLKNYHWNLGVKKSSQYNDMLKLMKKPKIDLKENEILFISNNNDINKALQNLMKSKKVITISGKKYNIKITKNIKELDSDLTAIIGDSAVNSMKKSSSTMHIKNTSLQSKKELEDKVEKLKIQFKRSDYEPISILLNKYGFTLSANTKTQIYNESKMRIGQLLYIALYLGFVFLISSAAVLAIQQLTEASDSLNRYSSLKKIGASNNMINKTIFAQILIHFMLPLTLALIHFGMALKIINRSSNQAGLLTTFNMQPTIIVTVISILIIYGGYFYATYLSYKNIVKNN